MLKIVPGTSEELPQRFRDDPKERKQVYRKFNMIPVFADHGDIITSMTTALIRAQGFNHPLSHPLHMPPPDPRGHIKGNEGRCLVTPSAFSDANLLKYLCLLAPGALSHSRESSYPDLSPRIVPLLLGGMPFAELEVLTERALAVLQVEEEEVEPTLARAMRLIGFGAEQRHIHHDALNTDALIPHPGEEPKDYLRRVAEYQPPMPPASQDESRRGVAGSRLIETKGPFAECLPQLDLYGFELDRKVLRYKWEIMAETTRLFHIHSGVIPEASRIAICASGPKWMDETFVTPAKFAEAVRWVFEKPWYELDLYGAVPDDVVKVMARMLIHRLGKTNRGSARIPGQISPRAMLGMSLLTGIPTPKFVRFAVAEQARRGETFLSADSVRRMAQLVDESEVFQYASSDWMTEMNELALRLEVNRHPVREYFAYRIRQGNAPLTSSMGVYQIVEFNDDEVPKFRPRLDARLNGLHEEI